MNEKQCRRLLKARSEDVCEICARARATELHHRKNRSQGGGWCPSNAMHLCHSCHMHVTVTPTVSREQGWSVPSWANPVAIPVWLAGHGWMLLSADGAITPTERSAA